MARTVRHFSLHRIMGTELRVVADVEAGVLPVIQVEETTIEGYARQGPWPHRWVTLFILQDLQPLIRQLRPETNLPPGGAAALNYRPVINVYDLADPTGCHVFVNEQAMRREGYWDDTLAIQGLLAHEHAHPLAENQVSQASRRLHVALFLEGQEQVLRQSTLLADKLCLYAPRELFANDLTIRSGFGEAMGHLGRCTVANARQALEGRGELCRRLDQQVAQEALTPVTAGALLLIADLKGYLDLALEIAPFYRAGRDSEGREMDTVLETLVFPHLEPQVAPAYAALRQQYLTLSADLIPSELAAWSAGVLDILARALAEKGLALTYRVQMTKC